MLSYRKSLAGIISLIRVHNLIGIALLSFASIAWSGQPWAVFEAISFSLGFVCLAAAGYSWNDLRDQSIDRLNRPTRPLVSGSVTPRIAHLVSATGSLMGTLLMAKLGTGAIVAALATVGALFFYSLMLKNKAGFVGNLLVAGCVAEIPLLAGILTSDMGRMMPLVATNFGLMLMREILKDLEDEHGDRAWKRQTLAVAPRAVVDMTILGASLVAIVGETTAAMATSNWPWRSVMLTIALLTLITSQSWRRDLSSLRLTQGAIRVIAFVFALTALVAGWSGVVKGK